MKFFAKGKRGKIYLKGKTAIKKKNPDSKAIGNLKNEYNMLKILNKYHIGPVIIKFEDDSLHYHFIEGLMFKDYIETATKSDLMKIITNVLQQIHKLDQLQINKFEMHHPWKHIIIPDKTTKYYQKNIPVLIDFERAKKTEKPKNVTQFLDFLSSRKLNNILVQKGILYWDKDLHELSRKYKKKYSREIYNQIKDYLQMKTLKQQCWYYVWKIPKGTTLTYGDIAEKLGNKGLSRAVGKWMSINPFAPIVPCHRVIATNNKIGGFARGVKNKRKLLKKEGVQLHNIQ